MQRLLTFSMSLQSKGQSCPVSMVVVSSENINAIGILCPSLPRAAEGHKLAFHCDVTSVCMYVHTCICHIYNDSLIYV